MLRKISIAWRLRRFIRRRNALEIEHTYTTEALLRAREEGNREAISTFRRALKKQAELILSLDKAIAEIDPNKAAYTGIGKQTLILPTSVSRQYVRDGTCLFLLAWLGRCGKPADQSGFCEEHRNEKCSNCGAQATHQCCAAGALVCGIPLCDECLCPLLSHR